MVSPETARPEREVTCPNCAGRSVFGPSNPWRPFCSERCRQMDFGAWATESYRVPAKPPDDEPASG